MAGEAIVEDLELDISAALTSIDTLSTALDSVASGFGANVADAISGAFGNIALPTFDAGSITSGLDSALGGVGTITPTVDEATIEQQVNDALNQPTAPIEVGADTAPVQSAIDAIDTTTVGTNLSTSLDDATQNVPPVAVTADTSAAQTSIDDLGSTALDVPVSGDVSELQNVIDGVNGTPVDVPVTGDVTTLEDAIAAIQPEPIDVPVTADTSGAQDAIDSLSSASGDASSSLDGLQTAAQNVGAATGIATGSVSDFVGSIGASGGPIGAAVAAGAAFTAFLGEAAIKTADAQAQQARFNQVFGASASIVQNINVGGLVTSLDDLGRASGTSLPDLEASASKLGQLGASAGVATPQVAQTTQQLLGLAATLSVTNPRLGDTAAVANGLEQALQRGGARLAQYGLAFSSAQIQQEAFRETGKTTAAELTSYDKIQAGVTLGVQQFGDKLGGEFATGAQSAQVQFRALKNEVEDSLIALGTPLISPIETVLKDVVPIALDVGTVLGNLAQIVLPSVGAAAALLAPVDGALKLIGDGLGVISSALSHLPAPVQLALLAAGMGAFAFATGTAEVAAIALGAALDFAFGPIGLALGAIAALGFAVDVFGGHTHTAADDAKDLGKALFDQIGSVTDLETAVAGLSDSFTKYATSSGGLQKDAPAVAAALKTAGASAKDLQTALGGSQQQFSGFSDALNRSLPPLDATASKLQGLSKFQIDVAAGNRTITASEADALRAHHDLNDQLDKLRTGYQQTVVAQLQFLATSGQLSNDQLLTFLAKAKDGQITYSQALDQATAAAAANAEQQSHNAIQTGIANGALLQSLGAYTLAQGGAEALAAALADLGISQADAKKIATDVAGETQKEADAHIAATPAAAQLAAQFATGQISAGQYAAALLQMGVSVDGLNSAMGEGTKAQSDYQSALTASSDATILASSSATHLRTELADGTITAAQAQAGFEALGVSVGGSEAALKGITDIATELADSVKKLPTAADALTSYSQTVASDTQKIATDMKDVAARHKGATQSLLTDTKQLADDSSPQRFIDNLNKQTLQIAAFQHNIDTLFSHGFTDVGALLASQGPAVAGGLAQALAGSPAQAAAANAAVTTSNKFTASYVGDIQGKIGEFSGAGVTAGQAVTNGVGQGLNGLTAKINAALATAGHAITSDPALAAAAGAAGDHVTTEFNGRFRIHDGVVDRSHQAATFLISGGNPIPGAAGTSATTATGAYDSALGLPGSTQNQMAAAGAVFGGQARVNLYNSAFSAGRLVGTGFDQGIAQGINGSTGVIASAAAAAAATAETAAKAKLKSASPSLVGVQIGQDFTAGIAIGLGATDSITTGALALTTALISAVPDPTASGVSIARAFTDGIASGLADHSAVTRNSVALTDTILKSIQGLSGAAFKAAHESTAALATIDPRAGAAANDVLNIESSKYAIAQEKLDAVRAQREAQVAFLQGQADTVKADLARSANDLTKIHQNQARITADTAQLKLIQAQNAAALTPPKAVTAATVAGVPFSPFTASPALSPFVAAAAGPAAGQGLVQFALTINLADGTTRQVTTEPIAVQPSRPGQLQQLVIAEVKAL